MAAQDRDDVPQVSGGGGAEQRQGQALRQIHERIDARNIGTGQTGQHGVVAAAQANRRRDEHRGQNHKEAHKDCDEIGQPSGVAGHFNGGDHQCDNTGSDNLTDCQRVKLRLA